MVHQRLLIRSYLVIHKNQKRAENEEDTPGVMLAEGFLRLLCYREERKFAVTSKQKRRQKGGLCSDPPGTVPDPNCTEPHTISAEEGFNQDVQGCHHGPHPRVLPRVPGLLIPGCSPATALQPVCVDDCSLLEQYPDLQVVDSGLIPHNPPRGSENLQRPDPELSPHPEAQQNQHGDLISSTPDQGYLVMGDRENISLDLPGLGLEPMSNSVLNRLLEKKLEEVYMQHLTDNLARCNSHLGNSLLHGLVPPPQPSHQSQALYSLETSLEKDSEGNSWDIYLSVPVVSSSIFSSPVLRISDLEHPQLQGDPRSQTQSLKVHPPT
ncbi:uncharacterized protein si:dkey-237j10.2 [Nothobranchius furzeri]|uniref:LOC107373523-like protein n=1 Tax=Nothobranchius furzeri TaxID=105023 RepID=A0A1A8U342_NOTFU|nr:putative LOC107373523-like protein [Nothobranchius furzeri]